MGKWLNLNSCKCPTRRGKRVGGQKKVPQKPSFPAESIYKEVSLSGILNYTNFMSNFIIGWCSQEHENYKKEKIQWALERVCHPNRWGDFVSVCEGTLEDWSGNRTVSSKIKIKGGKCCKLGSLSFSRWKKNYQLLYADGNSAVAGRTVLGQPDLASPCRWDVPSVTRSGGDDATCQQLPGARAGLKEPSSWAGMEQRTSFTAND